LTEKIVGKGGIAEFLSDKEGNLLYRLAKQCKGKGAIVEIGSWKGMSTIWLAKGSKAGSKTKVFAVDPHTGSPEHGKVNTFQQFKENIAKAEAADIVKPIVKTSEQAAKSFTQPVEFVFIDGNHDYKFVKQDFELWFPKLLEHGTIAFHDSHLWPGPRRVVREKVFNSKNFRNIGFVESITFAEKVASNSFAERLRNRHVLFLEQLYTLATKLSFAVPIPRPAKQAVKKIIGRAQ